MVPRIILAMGVIIWALIRALLTRRPRQPVRLPPTCDDPVADVLAGARPVPRDAGEELHIDDLRWMVSADELELTDELEQLALRRGGERGADFIRSALDGAWERHQPLLDGEPRQRDEQCGLARGEVDRWELVVGVERVAAAASAIGLDRHAGVLQRFEIAIDRPERDAEPIGELLCRDPGPPRAQRLRDRE